VRSVVAFVVGWCLAGTVAVLAAGQGVSLVADRVTSDRPAPLSPADVRRALERDAAAAHPEAAGDDGTTSNHAGPTSSAVGSAPSGGPSATLPAATATGDDRGARGGSGSSGGPATPVTTLPAPGTTVPAAPETVTRTYDLRGGTVTLRFSPSGVTVVVAQPAPAYALSVEPQHGNGLRVEFRSDDDRSRVEGWWDAGPHDQIDD
jgi:hypothetical protein